jgi:hypothetical protein
MAIDVRREIEHAHKTGTLVLSEVELGEVPPDIGELTHFDN